MEKVITTFIYNHYEYVPCCLVSNSLSRVKKNYFIHHNILAICIASISLCFFAVVVIDENNVNFCTVVYQN